MPSPDAAPALAADERRTLLGLARRSIDTGLREGRALDCDPGAFSDPLRAHRASFVTLRRDGVLRGCIGTLDACEALASNVAGNAWRAAFRDPRFPELREEELEGLELHISVLSPRQRLDVTSERALLEGIRPGVDGLVLRDGTREATFLPSVWDSLPEPAEFVRELRRKAGMARSGWSETLEVWRYTTEEWDEG